MEEEVGLAAGRVTLLGRLPRYDIPRVPHHAGGRLD